MMMLVIKYGIDYIIFVLGQWCDIWWNGVLLVVLTWTILPRQHCIIHERITCDL
jgi:hypothetical protein